MKLPDWMYLTKRERFALYFLFISILLGEALYLRRDLWMEENKPVHHEMRKWPVDVNKIDFKGLLEIPGIGPVLARRIIDYRKKRGGIIHIDELLRVKGIGPKLLRQISRYLYAPGDKTHGGD